MRSGPPLDGAAGSPTADAALVEVREDAIDEALDGEIRALLAGAFSEPASAVFLRRRFFLEPPERRFLAFAPGPERRLLAHAALRVRPLRAGGRSFAAGGISEVCVHPAERRRGRARRLVAAAHAALLREGIELSLLFGESRYYTSLGYRPASNVFRFWRPDELRWAEEAVTSALVCELGAARWPEGLVDLRGVLF